MFGKKLSKSGGNVRSSLNSSERTYNVLSRQQRISLDFKRKSEIARKEKWGWNYILSRYSQLLSVSPVQQKVAFRFTKSIQEKAERSPLYFYVLLVGGWFRLG